MQDHGQLEQRHHEETHGLIHLAINITSPQCGNLAFSRPEVCKYSTAPLYYIQSLLYNMTPWESTTEEKTFLGGLTVSSTQSVFDFYIQLQNKENNLIQSFSCVMVQDSCGFHKTLAARHHEPSDDNTPSACWHPESAAGVRARPPRSQWCPHIFHHLPAPHFAAQILVENLHSHTQLL